MFYWVVNKSPRQFVVTTTICVIYKRANSNSRIGFFFSAPLLDICLVNRYLKKRLQSEYVKSKKVSFATLTNTSC